MALPKLGSGARFKSLVAKIGKNPKVRNPSAVASSVGRKKFGATRFQSLASSGRRRKA